MTGQRWRLEEGLPEPFYVPAQPADVSLNEEFGKAIVRIAAEVYGEHQSGSSWGHVLCPRCQCGHVYNEPCWYCPKPEDEAAA